MCWIFSKLGKWTLVVKGKFSESFFHCKEILIQFQITSTLEVCEVFPVLPTSREWKDLSVKQVLVEDCFKMERFSSTYVN